LPNTDTSRMMAGIGNRCSALQTSHRHARQASRPELIDGLIDQPAGMVMRIEVCTTLVPPLVDFVRRNRSIA